MQDFRNLKVWEKAHGLTLAIYRCMNDFPQHENFGLRSHLRRSAMTISSKIAEGCGKPGDGEFFRNLQVAFAAASELEYVLLLARDLTYLPSGVHAELETAVVEVKRMLSGLFHKVQN